MAEIKVKRPTEEELKKLGVESWPIWEKEESEFDWYYDENETCYILEGEVEVTTEDGQKVTIKAGDLVTFPEGLRCRWKIKKRIRKHYKIG